MKIALIGAGGKIGLRIARNLKETDFTLRCVETGEAGRARLAELGLSARSAEDALPDADVAILAVPDTLLKEVSASVAPLLPAGALLLGLDPAAPLAGELTYRPDISCGVAHPCHPSIFQWEPTEDAFRDFYGGVAARQSAVVALVHGPESALDTLEKVAEASFAPVSRIHRLTLSQMALLEPGLAEALQQSCMEIVKEGLDEIVARGVPAEAARDFLLGHLRIQTAILFGETPGRFSDGAYRISAYVRPMIFRDDWKRVLTDESVLEQARFVTQESS